jgi:hypothetical protein
MPGLYYSCTSVGEASRGKGIVSDLPWNPNPHQDWRQLGGQPPYQGELYREAEDQPSDPEPDNGPEQPPKRRDRHTVRNILGGIGILAVAGLVVSALSSKGAGTPTPTSRTSASAAATASAAAQVTPTATAARPTGPGRIGSSFSLQDGSGDTYQVTLVKIIDPGKSADQFVTLEHGSRLVGIVFRITALTGSPQGEDANNDCTVVGTNGQVYTAGFDGIVGYTNFEVGVIHVAQGDTVVGAVTFELPQYIEVAELRWAASDGLGSAVVWYADT